MSLYLELSRPKGDTSRWEKLLPRLNLLNRYYPIKAKSCQLRDSEKLTNVEVEIYNKVKQKLFDEKVVFFGGFADTQYHKYTRSKKSKSKLVCLDVLVFASLSPGAGLYAEGSSSSILACFLN